MLKIALIVLLLAVLVSGCGAKQSSGVDDPCRDFDMDVKEVWNGEIKLRVDIAVKKLGGEVGALKAEELSTKMDNVTRDWVMLKESACNDHFKRKIISAEEYKDKAACFDAFLF